MPLPSWPSIRKSRDSTNLPRGPCWSTAGTNTVIIFYIYHTSNCVMCPLSAGVGSTGALITIDRALDQIQKEKVVDIAGIIQQLRNQRMKMVQNLVSVYIGEVITNTLLV